jgi:hypothetical protein
MAESLSDDELHLQVHPDHDDDDEELASLTGLLRHELLELDVAAVEPLADGQAPEDSKGGLAAAGGWLVVHCGPAGLKALVNAVAAWAGRTGKTVELTIGGNSLKLTGATAEVQSRIVEEFFARQAPSN